MSNPLWVVGQPAPYDLLRMPFPTPFLVEATNDPKATKVVSRGDDVTQALVDEITQHESHGMLFTGHDYNEGEGT